MKETTGEAEKCKDREQYWMSGFTVSNKIYGNDNKQWTYNIEKDNVGIIIGNADQVSEIG